MSESEIIDESPLDPDLIPTPSDPPPQETFLDMLARHDAEFAAWRALNAEKWIHCSRCDGFHKIAYLPRTGMCTSKRLEPDPAPPPKPQPSRRALEYQEALESKLVDDDEDEGPPLKKGPGPKRNAKAEAEVWMQIRTHRFHTGR